MARSGYHEVGLKVSEEGPTPSEALELLPLSLVVRESDYPFAVCKNCIRAFDFSYEWSLGKQDPTGKVKVILENDEGWLEIELECPQCFYRDLYRNGEFTWASSNETKRSEAMEAENESLRKKNSRLERQLSDAKKAKSRLLRDNKRLADSLLELLPEPEEASVEAKRSRQSTHSAYA